MEQAVVIDVGGTHTRFAIATIEGRCVADLSPAFVARTSDHAGIESAWEAYARSLGDQLPRAAVVAVACRVGGDVLKLTNNDWIIRPDRMREQLGLNHLLFVNDFGAVAHAVGQLDSEFFCHLCGPDVPLPAEGVISVVGPGTGLGVAQLIRRAGSSIVIETEGGHVDFAPVDATDDSILKALRERYPHVSAERIISGPGLVNIHGSLTGMADMVDDVTLWSRALDGNDPGAVAALDRFCLSLGSFAGDMALAHGAKAVVIAGGLGQRLAARLPRSGFAQRFAAKGRFADHLSAVPVKILIHPQPGLFGAAVAFAEERSSSTR